jgi:hypothetical protein
VYKDVDQRRVLPRIAVKNGGATYIYMNVCKHVKKIPKKKDADQRRVLPRIAVENGGKKETDSKGETRGVRREWREGDIRREWREGESGTGGEQQSE